MKEIKCDCGKIVAIIKYDAVIKGNVFITCDGCKAKIFISTETE